MSRQNVATREMDNITSILAGTNWEGGSWEDNLQLLINMMEIGPFIFQNASIQEKDLFFMKIRKAIYGKAHIILHTRQAKIQLPADTHSSIPIRFGELIYGTFCLIEDAKRPGSALLHPSFAHILAKVCGWLFYTYEQSTFLQGQYQKVESHIHGPLTKKERQVLTLMCRGLTQEEIAKELNVVGSTVLKHKQRIYGQLGVHNEKDALIVAYQTGMVSILSEIHDWRAI